jgi:hypothetical protein
MFTQQQNCVMCLKLKHLNKSHNNHMKVLLGLMKVLASKEIPQRLMWQSQRGGGMILKTC